MITQQEAEELAKKHVQDYMNACHCDTLQDAGNALMKLISVAGVTMCSAVGQQEAVARISGTAAFIARQPNNFRVSTVQ